MKKTKLSEILMCSAAIILIIALGLSLIPCFKYWKESGLWILINHFDEMKHIIAIFGIGVILYFSAIIAEKHKK